MKGIAQELRDMAWHKRHLEKRAKRKLIRALHLAESRMPKMIRKPVAPPELTLWDRAKFLWARIKLSLKQKLLWQTD